jgi:glutamate synthase domain-containing protein 2
MTKGGIILQGNTNRGVGLAMTGGIIVIRGSANGDVGQLLKGGTIIISGNTGSNSGAFMSNGDLIIGGNAGIDTGRYMNGGTIYVGGKIASLGQNTQIRELNDSDRKKLKKYFDHYGITKDFDKFKKILPLNRKPLLNELFNFKNIGETTDSKILNFLDEINIRTKSGLLDFYGPNLNSTGFFKYFDRLKILPAQTQPIDFLETIDPKLDLKLTIGSNLKSPLVLDSPFILATRGPGLISKSSKMAFMFAAGNHKTAVDVGGVPSSEEYEFKSKYSGQIIQQWNSNRLGMNIEHIHKSNAIELVLGNGGIGSFSPIIPSTMINTELRQDWNVPEQTDVILPPKLLDIDVPADLKRHVELLRELTDYKLPIIIKLAAGDVYEDTKLSIRAGADAIILEGFDASFRNLPTIITNNLGILSLGSIPPAVRALMDTRADKRGVKLIVSGLFRNGADVFKTLALGANGVVISNSAEIAIGCNLCGKCNTNNCTEGIATTDPKLEAKLDWVEAGQKLSNFLTTINNELKVFMSLTGEKRISGLNKNCLRALDYKTAAVTGAPLMGFDKSLPIWDH